MSLEFKVCRACGIKKPLSEFYKNAGRGALARKAQCRACVLAYWRRPDVKASVNQRKRLRYAANQSLRAKRRRATLGQYGLTPAEFEAMQVDQGGRCGICQTQPTKLHVDHDHGTGKVRGLLCSNCNNGLGRFKDSVDTTLRAAEYLVTHGPRLIGGPDAIFQLAPQMKKRAA